MHLKDLLGSFVRVGYRILVPDFYLVLHGLSLLKKHYNGLNQTKPSMTLTEPILYLQWCSWGISNVQATSCQRVKENTNEMNASRGNVEIRNKKRISVIFVDLFQKFGEDMKDIHKRNLITSISFQIGSKDMLKRIRPYKNRVHMQCIL